MDDDMKFVITQISENIKALREEILYFETSKVSKLECKSSRKQIELETNSETSLKKITIICSTISMVIAGLVTMIINIIK